VQRAALVPSELVTNAVLHGRAPIQLRLRLTARHAVIEVYDGTAVLPRRMRPTPDDEHGRGLQLVASLADRWGTRPLPHGKSVWCTVALRR
jgi:anti-sigma regulatory factor (Ser/Thr protein kinase)